MRRVVVLAVVTALAFLTLMPAASGIEQNQPGQGAMSVGRNEAGFGGGPHCHVLLSAGAQMQFEHIRVFPSHQGHASSGIGHVFAADPDCDGLPG